MSGVRRFILNAAIEASRIYLAATIASRMIKAADNEWDEIKKAGTVKKVFNAENIDLTHFQPHRVVYSPRALYTEAIQVDIDNIGALCLEFEAEIMNGPNGLYFSILVNRISDNGEKTVVRRQFEVGDWLVALWGELYRFPHLIYINTFEYVESKNEPDGGAHLAKVIHDAGNAKNPFLPLGQKTYPDGSFESKFKPNDRVRVVGSTNDHGTVTVVDVEYGDGTSGIEVLLDNTSMTYVFNPSELELLPFEPNKGEVSGPSGTSFIPKVQN